MKEFQQKNSDLFSLHFSHYVYLSFVTILSITLNFFPMTNVIGYESSVATGIFLCFFGGLSMLVFLKFTSKSINIVELLKKSWPYFLILFILPFSISCISTILFEVCPIWEGTLFHFVITLPSLFIGIVLAVLVNFTLNRFHSIFFCWFF